ncbi:MAG TPA: GntR family transcriptional regulator [Burkholderiaceae bacterium]
MPGTISVQTRSSASQIANRVVDAILAGRITPGQRLGEQELADVFGVSRTLVREAMARLSARGMVEVSSRRGWFVVQPSRADAAGAFSARIAIETGMLRSLDRPLARSKLSRLKAHYKAEEAAIAAGDAGNRSFLLGDFHVCLAECVSGALLADILRDLTARTTLVASWFQSTHDAAVSCREHVAIVAALEQGDAVAAADLMRAHIDAVAAALRSPTPKADPLDPLRRALQPRDPEAAAPKAPRGTRRLFNDLLDKNLLATRAPQRRHKEI